MSRPGGKFLIEPSRKFLLTAERLKDGTNRDEPRGTGLAGVVETSSGRQDDAAGSGRSDGSERALGAEAAGADEEARRCRGGAWIAREVVEPETVGKDEAGRTGDVAQAGLARFRADVCGRAVMETPSDRGRQGNAARVDGRNRTVEAGLAPRAGGARLAAAAQRVRRAGAMGYFRSRLAGRSRAGALSGTDD